VVAIPILAFVVFFAGVYGAYWAFVLRPEQQIAGVARKRLRGGKGGTKESKRRSAILKQIEAMSSVGSIDAVLRRSQSRVKGLQVLIQQSGATVTVGTVLAGSATLALLAFVVVQRFLSGPHCFAMTTSSHDVASSDMQALGFRMVPKSIGMPEAYT
jgi:hypothetical protein